MAVPRKRKKLAETPERQAKRVRTGTRKQASKKRKPATASSKKIDAAFKLMTDIEDNPQKQGNAPKAKASPPVERKDPSLSKPPSNRPGFRFQISLDALMPDNARRFSETRKQPVKESTVIDIDLTIPFIWDLPVIGRVTQKFFKNFKTIKL